MSGDKYDVADLENLSLYPKVRLPYGFKWPEIDKYNGTECITKLDKKRLTSEEDQIAMVLKSRNPEYTNRLTLTHHPTFHSLVCAGCQIEDALEAGRSLPSLRRSFTTGPRIISRKSLPGPLRLKQR